MVTTLIVGSTEERTESLNHYVVHLKLIEHRMLIILK